MKFEYRVYEVSKDCPRGKVIKDYKDKERALDFVSKSIYRFCKKIEVWG